MACARRRPRLAGRGRREAVKREGAGARRAAPRRLRRRRPFRRRGRRPAPGGGRAEAGRRDAVGAVRHAGPGLVRPGRDHRRLPHALLGALRAARRAREAGAGWIVPRKYVEKVGDDGFKRQPVGLGPYKFVSHTPGIELVMEAFEGYWRKVPAVKRLVFKSVPEPTTRAAMLKNGEVDVAYMLDTPTAQQLRRDPGFRLGFSGAIGVHYLDFFDQ